MEEEGKKAWGEKTQRTAIPATNLTWIFFSQSTRKGNKTEVVTPFASNT